MANDIYLDSGKVLRDLARAEETHNLDNRGVIEKLRDAVRHCSEMGKIAEDMSENYRKVSDAYSLARGQYLAEIKRRVEAEGSSFSAWHRESGDTVGVGLSASLALRLIRAVNSSDPEGALVRDRAQAAAHHKLAGRERKIRSIVDPLYRAKREWRKLSPLQQVEYHHWVTLQLHSSGSEAVTEVKRPRIAPKRHRRKSPPATQVPEWRLTQAAGMRASKALKRQRLALEAA